MTTNPTIEVDEIDLVEIIGALETTAAVHKLTGGHIMSAHYAKLATDLGHRMFGAPTQ